MAETPIIAFDYDISPFGLKVRAALAASGITFQRSDQPALLPRPILEDLAITYRRIPLLAFGKDVYCDSALIIDEIQSRSAGLVTSPADKAYETFGLSIIASALQSIPTAALTPEFVKDRVTIFPGLADPDFALKRPSGVAGMRAKFSIIENEFLAKSPGPFIAGSHFGLADVNAGFAVGWCLNVLGLVHERGFSERDFPRIYEWVASWPKASYTDVSPEAMKQVLMDAGFSAKEIGIDENDPLGLKAGTKVSVESDDAKAGAHLQLGELVGVDARQVVVQVESGLRLHFPRIGYVIEEVKA